jgi:hypothetical protein
MWTLAVFRNLISHLEGPALLDPKLDHVDPAQTWLRPDPGAGASREVILRALTGDAIQCHIGCTGELNT